MFALWIIDTEVYRVVRLSCFDRKPCISTIAWSAAAVPSGSNQVNQELCPVLWLKPSSRLPIWVPRLWSFRSKCVMSRTVSWIAPCFSSVPDCVLSATLSNCTIFRQLRCWADTFALQSLVPYPSEPHRKSHIQSSKSSIAKIESVKKEYRAFRIFGVSVSNLASHAAECFNSNGAVVALRWATQELCNVLAAWLRGIPICCRISTVTSLSSAKANFGRPCASETKWSQTSVSRMRSFRFCLCRLRRIMKLIRQGLSRSWDSFYIHVVVQNNGQEHIEQNDSTKHHEHGKR